MINHNVICLKSNECSKRHSVLKYGCLFFRSDQRLRLQQSSIEILVHVYGHILLMVPIHHQVLQIIIYLLIHHALYLLNLQALQEMRLAVFWPFLHMWPLHSL